jgi:type IV pilus assembly protein PilM
MAAAKGVWGIDIGQCALKALRIELHEGQVQATNFDYIEHPKILSQPDADPDQLTREALDQFLSRNSLKGDLVAIAVPGQSGLARFVKLPPVEEKKVGDIVKFEAKQQIPFPLEEVVWDYQKIGSGAVADGFALETEIGLFAMKRDIIARGLQHYQDVGVEVDIIQMAPLALCNFVGYEMLGKGGPGDGEAAPDDTPKGKRRCAVALDIGADASNLVVTDGEKVIWQRPIPLGGNHLTRALSKELKLTFAKAEHLKRNAAKSPPDLKQILTSLRPVLSDLVGEVQRSLGYFTNSHREAHVAFLVGLGSAFRLPGLQKYIGEKLGIEVRKPAKFSRLTGDELVNAPVFSENLLGFAVAYGLAVQGAKGLAKPDQEYGRLVTNLLPPEIRKERLIKAKKPWAIAAAALLFAGSGIMTAGYAWSYSAVNNKQITTACTDSDAAVGRVTARNRQVEEKQTEVVKTYNDVNSIVAGKGEQLNWIRLNEYINRALPQPDGKNLELNGNVTKPGGNPEPPPGEHVPRQVAFWNTDVAKQAAQDFLDRVKFDESGDAPIDDVLRENLCHVDIESIQTLFTPSVKQFYDTTKKESLDKTGKEFNGMLFFDVNNPPKDGEGGWVVALSGTTYNKGGPTFVRDTLVYNLARMCNRNFAPGAASQAAPASLMKGGDDPIKDRVTHVFLWNCWAVEDPKPGVFSFINKDYLKPLVMTSAAAPTDPPAPGSGRDSWVPLVSGIAGGGAASGYPTGPTPPVAGGRNVPRGGDRGAAGGRGVPQPGGDSTPAPAPDSSTPANVRAKPGYEFVVIFIWREPTPSDKLVPGN